MFSNKSEHTQSAESILIVVASSAYRFINLTGDVSSKSMSHTLRQFNAILSSWIFIFGMEILESTRLGAA